MERVCHPSKAAKAAETNEFALPPPTTEPPVEVASVPTAMPQVKIIFTPGVTPTAVVQQQVNNSSQPRKRRIETIIAADLSRSHRQNHPKMLQRLEFHAMGSEMLAVIESSMLSQTLPAVTRWFEEWEQVLSRFRYDSELTRLNQIHEHPVQVSEVLWDVFQAAQKAEQMTNGLVTPTS